MRVIYDGPHDAVEVPDLAAAGLDPIVERGVPVDVPDEIAGREPSGLLRSGEPGDDYDPGEGLLAQETWRRAGELSSSKGRRRTDLSAGKPGGEEQSDVAVSDTDQGSDG